MPVTVPAVKPIPIIKPPGPAPEQKPADADAAGKKDIVQAMAAASISDKQPIEAATSRPAQNGPASTSVARPATSVPEDKVAPVPVPAPPAKAAVPEKLLVPEDKPAPAIAQPATTQPSAVQPAIAAKNEQPQASAPVKEVQPSAPAAAVPSMLSYAARVKQAAAPKQPPMPVQEPQVCGHNLQSPFCAK